MDNGKCWICGNPASSREHRLKKADIIRAYGRGPYRGEDAPVHIREEVISPLQGPNAQILKYAPSLCHECNTTVTQPFDFAYDKFVSWVYLNEDVVLYGRYIDFFEVFGADFELQQRNLYKYFAKSFGCRLVNAGQEVPWDVISLLWLTSFQTKLRITCSVNEDVLLLPKQVRNGFIGKGNMLSMVEANDPTQITGFIWNERFSWFTINYWYGHWPEPRSGSIWIADSQCVYLGNYNPVPPDVLAEALNKLKC